MVLNILTQYPLACKQALPILNAVVGSEGSRGYGNAEATENAISAILKIVKNPAHGVNLAETLPTIMGWLPITEDREEAEFVYGYLCDLVAEGNAALVENDECQ